MSPADELPVGTVTFLFTDIEGSTRLLKQLRDRYAEVLEEHQRILREALAAHDGHEIDTQGDSFFVAFRRAKEAVAAAVQGQRRLGEHEWPDGTELRVRMGIHTGEPAAAGQTYVGLGVHRAARISAAGHGGQVLVSQATRELLRDDPLPDVSLRDLGEHQLKDLDEPERLFQLVAPGLEETFPPLKTAGVTPFEGREDELAEAAAEQMAARWRRPGRRTLILATFGAAVIGVVAGVLLTQGGGSTASASIQPNSVGVINPSSGGLASSFSAGASPGGVAVGDGATWVTNTDADTVSRIDAGSSTPIPIQVGSGPVGVTVCGHAVWVTNGLDGTVSRIDLTVNRAGKPIRVGNGPLGIACGGKKVWVANSVDGTVSEIDTRTWKPRTVTAVPGATALVVAFGRVWVVSPPEGVVMSLDQDSGDIADPRIAVGVDPGAVTASAGAIWVANRDDRTVSEITPKEPVHLARTLPAGGGPISVAAANGGVWVANGAEETLVRIAPSRKVVHLANAPQALAGTDQGLYVAVRSNPAEHRGGTLRVRRLAPDFLDPARAYLDSSWQILSMLNDGLVGFRRIGGIEGVQLVPDLALSLPTPTDGGSTYTFRLRSGVRYSTGKLVQPADFRTAIERILKGRGALATGQYFRNIVGAEQCRIGHPCDLSRGIIVGARTVTFHLTKPDPDFLSKLALISAVAVPSGTPVHAHTVPATGPYKIASYPNGRSLTLVRNPYFWQWSPDAQPDGYPDKIVFSLRPFGTDSESEVRSVELGKADIAPNLTEPPLPKGQLVRLRARYPSQLLLTPSPTTDYLFLNTRRPPFNDVRVRLAVNDALDRRAYSDSLGPGFPPTCQVLPPDFPGYRKTCPYGPGGREALRAAKRLVRVAGRGGARVTFWTVPPETAQDRFVVHLLNSIGLQAHVKLYTSDLKARAQIGGERWLTDYPSDSGFMLGLFSCGIHTNVSKFCGHAVGRLFTRAEAAQGENPVAAPALWQKAERAVLAQAPIVPTDNPENVAFLAKRVHNFQYHLEYEVLLDQLWLR